MNNNSYINIRLLDIVSISRESVKEFDGIKKYLSTGDLDFDKIVNLEDITWENKPSRANQLVKENDVLFAKMKDTKKTLIIDDAKKDLIVSTGFYVLTVSEKIMPKYLYYFLSSEIFLRDKNKLCKGATQKALNNEGLSKIKILLPNLNLQYKTIDILDKAKNLIDKRKLQLEYLDELVKSKFIEMFGDPVSNPKGWDVGKLGKISSVGSSKRVFVDELVSEGIPFYRGTEIGALSTGEKIEPTLFITKEHYEKLKDSTGVPVIGDLLMPSICPDGRIWSVDTQMPFYFKDGRVLWIHLENSSIDSMFLKHMLREKFNRDYNKIASGTTFAELKIFALKDLDIIMPPIEIQKKYSNFVKYTDKLKFEMEKSLKQLEDNFNSLMQRAFKGELFN